MARPKTLYWQARVRAVDKNGCVGNWSDWTAPGLPWTGADPKPPAPIFLPVPITFERVEVHKHHKLRARVTWFEVTNFDYPGSPADDETDVSAYAVELATSTDGINEVSTNYRSKHKVAKDSDADATATAVFGNVHRRYWYRARVRTIDRFNRRSDWSNWSAWILPFDDQAPPKPIAVKIYDKGIDRVILDWTAPTLSIPSRGLVSNAASSTTVTGTGTAFLTEIETGTTVKIGIETRRVTAVTSDTSLTVDSALTNANVGVVLYEVVQHPDVVRFRAQISTSPSFTTIYKEDDVVGSKKAFKVADADINDTYYGRVRSIDGVYNKSQWVDATIIGNSLGEREVGAPNPDGVTIGKGSGGGMMVATFTKPGRVKVRHYPYRWVNLTGQTLVFKRARAVVSIHDSGTHPNDGCPTGSAMNVAVDRWLDDESAFSSIFDADTRLHIDAATHKDTVPVTSFNIITLAPEEQLSINVKQVGSNFPGEDLVVQVYMEPST